ncbi:ser-Thr-rich glycosyl-phosphatidyl-inositol-anchored membrane family domain-containing protein [Cordyceps javanica]|uniref:Ser-Thr-rich glycosyl-phosphatidyl-inositol-anchored membrane family domain-containing protein n=1 Tax=Cordyceps javanica TaxID=43265 RepID=A0A545W9Q8_9HYPO|nr:ser-Thr-rich glycosyl-phosphatidyl-inositol-anchored membrane family domain-containing protein [Cordyceps javanica]TQW10615.1 ser-Thr-rich glycosyl-phosphatidyl-inositol-anchored membrane family domain-containing protein [Cordyceps javanica]
MRFTLATVLAFASAALAAVATDPTADFDSINTPEKGEKVPAGKPYTVRWKTSPSYQTDRVYIQLLGGKDPNTLVVKNEKLATVDNGDSKWSWDVASSLGDDATYGLRFVLERDESIVQYSQPFQIVKAEGSSSSGSSSDTNAGTATQTPSQGGKSSSASASSSAATSATSAAITTSAASGATTSSAGTSATTAPGDKHGSSSSVTCATKANSTSLTTSQSSSQSSTQSNPPAPVKSTNAAGRAAGPIAALGLIAAGLFAL